LAAEPSTEDRPPKLGQSVEEVSQRVSVLVREEIELLQAELQVKAQRLARGAAAGAVAGVLGVVGLLFILHGVAWVFAEEIFNRVWAGYLVTAALLFVFGGILGYLAYRLVKKAMPPTPELTIEEAKRIKETVQEARS
jgi:uncharacterized membrane protein YqjE